jgi:hypothetical protein
LIGAPAFVATFKVQLPPVLRPVPALDASDDAQLLLSLLLPALLLLLLLLIKMCFTALTTHIDLQSISSNIPPTALPFCRPTPLCLSTHTIT